MERTFLEALKKYIESSLSEGAHLRVYFHFDTLVVIITTDRQYCWSRKRARGDLNTLDAKKLARCVLKGYEKYILSCYFMVDKTGKNVIL